MPVTNAQIVINNGAVQTVVQPIIPSITIGAGTPAVGSFGPAGGDLSGTYPNPSIADGAVDLTTAKVTGILPIAKGGTGSASKIWWELAGTSSLAALTTIDRAANRLNFNGTTGRVDIVNSGAGFINVTTVNGSINIADNGSSGYISVDASVGSGRVQIFGKNSSLTMGDGTATGGGSLGFGADFTINDQRALGSGRGGLKYVTDPTGGSGVTSLSILPKSYIDGAKTYTAKQTFFTSIAGSASINIPDGSTPTAPSNGDIWGQGDHLFIRLNGVSYQLDQPTVVGTITTGTWNGTRLTNAYTPQGSALSVWGVAGNAIADQASIIAGSDYQVLRRSGTSIGFGAIDISQSNAIGSSILAVANGGTGTSTAFTSGDIVFAGASGIYTHDAGLTWNNSSKYLQLFVRESSFGNVVSTQLRVSGRTTLTPGVGIGSRIEFEAQTGASTFQIGNAIESVTTNITGGTEAFDLVFKNMDAGSTAAESFRITSIADIKIGTGYGGSSRNIYSDGTASNVDLVLNTKGGGSLAEQLRITSDGRVYGKSLHNNSGSVTGTTNQYIASGTYSPTITGVTNVSSSSGSGFMWTRVGNIVHVAGNLAVSATSVALTEVAISLPIASNLTNTYDLHGCGTTVNQVQEGCVVADTTNDRALYRYGAQATGNLSMEVVFMYLII